MSAKSKKAFLKNILKKGMKEEKEPKGVKDSSSEDKAEMPSNKYKNLKK